MIEKKNSQGQFHCEDGPALIDPGVCNMYYLNGVLSREDGPALEFLKSPEDSRYILNGVALMDAGEEIGKKIVMDGKNLTFDEVIKIANVEVQRIAIERMNVEKFLIEGKAEVLDSDTNDIEGTHETVFSIKHNNRILSFFCGVCKSTGRVYYISINAECNTCKKARQFMSSGKDMNKCVGAS